MLSSGPSAAAVVKLEPVSKSDRSGVAELDAEGHEAATILLEMSQVNQDQEDSWDVASHAPSSPGLAVLKKLSADDGTPFPMSMNQDDVKGAEIFTNLSRADHALRGLK